MSVEEKLDIKAKQGILVPGLEMKAVGKDGEVKWDGKEMGELAIRGPWIASEYYKDDRTAKWWLPDEILFMEEIPKTSVGKFLKMALRDQVQQQLAAN
ncbi:long-chain-fatty-acid--CoA ligase [Mycobacteroides abscessus subsp. abscessus]|nr:long-chain-fatty-acid--CoA ligase [Mycobacteroides abscessus subsp. abscessus]